MNEEVITRIGGMVFVLVLIVPLSVVLVWQGFKTWQVRTTNRADVAREEVYRKLVEESIATQQKLLEDQQNMVKDLTEIKMRVHAIEKMLQEID